MILQNRDSILQIPESILHNPSGFLHYNILDLSISGTHYRSELPLDGNLFGQESDVKQNTGGNFLIIPETARSCLESAFARRT